MNLIKSHKIVTATILVGVIGSAVGIAVINQPVDNQVRHVSEVVVDPGETVKETPPATTPVTEPENVLEAPSAEVVDVPVYETEAPVEEPIADDAEFWNQFYFKVVDKHEAKNPVTDMGMYNAIHRAYRNNPSAFLPSKVDNIIDSCIRQLELKRVDDPHVFFLICEV